MTIVSLPLDIWHLYVDNLVKYEQGSWVNSIASTCRILAVAAILPFILLTLLDVASYVIARTLGVIDETKASTTGEVEILVDKRRSGQPTIVVERDGGGDGRRDGNGDRARGAATPHPLEPPEDVDGNLKLAGVDTFSPAPSQPGSPTLQRREFMQHEHAHYGLSWSGGAGLGSGSSLHLQLQPEGRGGRAEEGRGRECAGKRGDGGGDDDGGSGATTPRDPAGNGSGGSSSGDSSSSYAIVDRDSGSEDAGVVLRRRTRQTGTGPAVEDGAA